MGPLAVKLRSYSQGDKINMSAFPMKPRFTHSHSANFVPFKSLTLKRVLPNVNIISSIPFYSR